MRTELLNLDWHDYGLSLRDYGYTLRLVKNMIQDRNEHLPNRIEGAIGYDQDGNVLSGAENRG